MLQEFQMTRYYPVSCRQKRVIRMLLRNILLHTTPKDWRVQILTIPDPIHFDRQMIVNSRKSGVHLVDIFEEASKRHHS